MKAKKLSRAVLYRKCSCGETAHECTYRLDERALVIWACRNCKAERTSSSRRSVAIATLVAEDRASKAFRSGRTS